MNSATVQLVLRRRSASFLNAIALPNYAIASPTALRKYKADAGTVDSTGTFRPEARSRPESGRHGTVPPEVVAGREPPRARRRIRRTGARSQADPRDLPSNREQAPRASRHFSRVRSRASTSSSGRLRNGSQQPEPSAPEPAAVHGRLRRLEPGEEASRQPARPPGDRARARQGRRCLLRRAGAPREPVPAAGTPGYAASGVRRSTYNPDRAKALLRQAGLTLRWRSSSRIPRASRARTCQTPSAMPRRWARASRSPASRSRSSRRRGEAGLPHCGAVGELPALPVRVDRRLPGSANFLNVHFGSRTDQFGFTNQGLFSLLQRADAETNVDARLRLYQQAGRQVMRLLPMVPYVHARGGKPRLPKNVRGYKPARSGR